MISNRYYNFQSILHETNLADEVDFIFVGNSTEIRSLKVHSSLKNQFKGLCYSINYDIEYEKYSINKFDGEIKFIKEDLNKDGKHLNKEFINNLKDLGIDNKRVLIDITSIKHPLMFYIILVLKTEFSLKNLFITYTEPESYVQEKKNNFLDNKFDLTERFCQVNSLPGFLRLIDYSKEKLLVALMGFEGNRFKKAYDDINPAERKTYAIVGFPSFHPNWQYYVYSKNQNALEQSRAVSLIKRTTANEPFGIYNLLAEIKDKNKDYELFLAPIGTKPHSLGACMFAIDNKETQLYYDFPSYGDKKRTVGVGKSFLYNLTDYINEK